MNDQPRRSGQGGQGGQGGGNRNRGGGGGGRSASSRRRTPAARKPADVWRAVPDADPPAGIAPAVDPTAVLRSLGAPPLPGQADADRYLAAVIERASGLAIALAAAADLLEPTGEGDGDA